MKTNPNDCAYPHMKIGNDVIVRDGLTKREYFASMAMQGIEASNFISNEQDPLKEHEVVKRAVRMADALIEQLNKGDV